MHYLLFYEVAEDYVSRRAEFRKAHLDKAWKASERGDLVLGGALANPVDGAVLLFKGDSPGVAEKFARDDPYVTNGLVTHWYVREWTTVAGYDAAMPIRPEAAPQTPGSQQLVEQARGKVLRMWRARSTIEKVGGYVHHATTKVFPALRAIEGYRGAYLGRRSVDGAIELVVLTLWDSMAAVRKFAGEELEKAVVEPQAKTFLTTFDELVTHLEVVVEGAT
jgi:uncharacterized protein